MDFLFLQTGRADQHRRTKQLLAGDIISRGSTFYRTSPRFLLNENSFLLPFVHIVTIDWPAAGKISRRSWEDI
jgi:hypothetical protein